MGALRRVNFSRAPHQYALETLDSRYLAVGAEAADLIELMASRVAASDAALEVAPDWRREALQEAAERTPHGLASDRCTRDEDGSSVDADVRSSAQ